VLWRDTVTNVGSIL